MNGRALGAPRREGLRRRVRHAALSLAAVVGPMAWFLPAEAQTPGQVAGSCVQAGGDLNRCVDVAVAARALTGDLVLLSGWGSEVPGSASTLGRKIGNTPRLATSLRLGTGSIGLPDIFDQGTGAAPDVAFLVPAASFAVALGVLDGFSPMPTVGGVLSLDLVGSVAVVMPPSAQGFHGRGTAASVGARVGILRESFTLPGVTVSAVRRFISGSALGRIDLGDPAALEVDPAVTSVRATVGKDLFGVGVLAGVGWDDASAETLVAVTRMSGEPAQVRSRMDADRRLYFGGLAMNFLLLQLSLEGGWAQGYAAVPGGAGSSFDSGRNTPFASLSLRFTP